MNYEKEAYRVLIEVGLCMLVCVYSILVWGS